MLIKALRMFVGFPKIEKQLKIILKSVNKLSSHIEVLKKVIAIQKKEIAHQKKVNKVNSDRVSVIEAWQDNIEKISSDYMKDIAN